MSLQMSDFDFSRVPSLDRQLVMHLFEEGFVDNGENAIIIGRPRTGKTHIASALMEQVKLRGKTVELLRPQMPWSAPISSAEVQPPFAECDLLVIDGLEQVQEERSPLPELILQRYQSGKSTLITSNFTLAEMKEMHVFGVATTSVLRRFEVGFVDKKLIPPQVKVGIKPWYVMEIIE